MLSSILVFDTAAQIIVVLCVAIAIITYLVNILDYFLWALMGFFLMLGFVYGLLGEGAVFLFGITGASIMFVSVKLYQKAKNH